MTVVLWWVTVGQITRRENSRQVRLKRRRLRFKAVLSTLGSYLGGISLRHVYGDRLYG
jgi:hypothetical protein